MRRTDIRPRSNGDWRSPTMMTSNYVRRRFGNIPPSPGVVEQQRRIDNSMCQCDSCKRRRSPDAQKAQDEHRRRMKPRQMFSRSYLRKKMEEEYGKEIADQAMKKMSEVVGDGQVVTKSQLEEMHDTLKKRPSPTYSSAFLEQQRLMARIRQSELAKQQRNAAEIDENHHTVELDEETETVETIQENQPVLDDVIAETSQNNIES